MESTALTRYVLLYLAQRMFTYSSVTEKVPNHSLRASQLTPHASACTGVHQHGSEAFGDGDFRGKKLSLISALGPAGSVSWWRRSHIVAVAVLHQVHLTVSHSGVDNGHSVPLISQRTILRLSMVHWQTYSRVFWESRWADRP